MLSLSHFFELSVQQEMVLCQYFPITVLHLCLGIPVLGLQEDQMGVFQAMDHLQLLQGEHLLHPNPQLTLAMAGTQEGLQRDETAKPLPCFPLIPTIPPYKTQNHTANQEIRGSMLLFALSFANICIVWLFVYHERLQFNFLQLMVGTLFVHLSAGSVAHRLFPFPKCVVELYTLLEHSMHFLLLIYSECIVMWFRNINRCCKLGSELQSDWLWVVPTPLAKKITRSDHVKGKVMV